MAVSGASEGANMALRRLAIIISRVFGPLSSIPLVLVYLCVFETGLTTDVRSTVAVMLLLGLYLLPLAIALFFVYSRRVSDVDITERKERVSLLSIIVILQWLILFYVFIMPVTLLFKDVLLFSVLSFTAITVLTFFDKVSLHISGVTTLLVVVVQLLGWQCAISFVLILIVAWARFYLGKHNMLQMLIGLLVPILLFLTEYLVMLE